MELPDSMIHVQNQILQMGAAKADQNTHQFFSGGRFRNADTGEAIEHCVWDVTDYTPHGIKSRELDDINHMIRIDEWELLPNATRVDMKYAREICLQKSRPALIVQFEDPNGKVFAEIADGNHRIAKANMERMRSYPAHILSLSESNAIRVPENLAKEIWESSQRQV